MPLTLRISSRPCYLCVRNLPHPWQESNDILGSLGRREAHFDSAKSWNYLQTNPERCILQFHLTKFRNFGFGFKTRRLFLARTIRAIGIASENGQTLEHGKQYCALDIVNYILTNKN